MPLPTDSAMLTEQQQRQHSGLANRSFLYRGSNSDASIASSSSTQQQQQIVYATLDSLAFQSTLQRRSSQPKCDGEADAENHSECAMPEATEALTHHHHHHHHQQTRQTKTRSRGYTFPGDKQPLAIDKSKKKCSIKRFGFAKSVLHYVPVQSRRYYRKSRDLASKSLSLGDDRAPHQQQQKWLSREQLKYLSISPPSNFVHLDSGSRYLDDSNKACTKYAEIASFERSILPLNQSFAWLQFARLRHRSSSDDYDDVGPAIAAGPLQTESAGSECSRMTDLTDEPLGDQEQQVYDDVGPPTRDADHESELQEVYDDVGPPARPAEQSVEPAEPEGDSENEADSVELPSPPAAVEQQQQQQQQQQEHEDDIYDDVGPAVVQSRPQLRDKPHERVNSLYNSGSLHLACYRQPTLDEDNSEWEDLEDTTDSRPRSEQPEQPASACSFASKKKGPRWSCKLRRQKSKATTRSTSRSSRYSSKTAAPIARPPSHSTSPADSSDDSNYETLQSFEPDDFSSSGSDSASDTEAGCKQTRQQPAQQEPPSRPIPAPPREESLGHSLGRRMKILRRTWSITKGSLGRMRRRASAELSDTPEVTAATYDPRKYFSFKKAFGKLQAAQQTQSTFYLDKSSQQSTDSENESGRWYQEAGLYASSSLSSDHTDHYSVLTEEPLYQFYAANATRVAFESDSDGYEEVEEVRPSSATTDLARPGHRTLWCQTPQVLNSGLLESLTPEERKIQEAKFEILTSEASYVNSLRVLENEFASDSELSLDILSCPEREQLFGGVGPLLAASERFLGELEAAWRIDPLLPALCSLLLAHARRSGQLYADYCAAQVSAEGVLRDLKARKGERLTSALGRIERRPGCQALSLHSFLMLPMQRVTRLPLLADAVLSRLAAEHPERRAWQGLLAELSRAVARCNEAARQAEGRARTDELARRLEYPAGVSAVELRGRCLVRSGPVVQLSARSDADYRLTFGSRWRKRPLVLLLLTDYLLVGKPKCGGGGSGVDSEQQSLAVLQTCKRSLVALEGAGAEEGPLAGRHAMLLTLLENQEGRQVELLLSCGSASERERWLEAVSPPKASCLGETLYESWDCPQVMALYCYAPLQPDEIALQPGDVINVLRKMNDGWMFGEKLLDGEQGWFPGNFSKEVASEHVRARNLRQRHRFLATSGSALQRKAKQSLSLL